jgi:hypothetical protein
VKTDISALLLGFFLCLVQPAAAQDKANWWSAEVDRSLERAGANHAELVKALKAAPEDQRKGMAFLIANMPERDLKTLKADFLLDNVERAYQVRKQAPWSQKVPEEIFLNDVLPYVNIDEARHPWRKELYELCWPLVKDCKTASEAAQVLNSKIFPKLKVRFSTQRKKASQSPKETIETGLASCTGLSILLSDACRSVGVPARLVGTPLWANLRGNHTWVEVWDGDWHFTGAAEQDPKGLDRGWFVGDAVQAKADSPKHAIYAASFRTTKVSFPLVWAPSRTDVYAENVTSRYAKSSTLKDNHTRVSIRVLQSGGKKRLALPVSVVDGDKADQVFRGDSRGETADPNDMLTFDLLKNHSYVLRLGKPVRLEKSFKTGGGKEQLVEVEAPGEKPKKGGEKTALSDEQVKQIEKAAREIFTGKDEKRAEDAPPDALDECLAQNEEAVRRIVWKAYQNAPIHAEAKKDFDKNQVRYEKHLSPYTVKKVGKRPAKGWPLFIAMHGGGGVPKQINDSQWDHMKIYYKDQKSVEGYLYLALRAPNDVWNGFYDNYVPPLVSNLIRQFLLFGDVDPDKVFLMGYSHGGYGAFFIGPKIPDRFAAVHASAAAPTDGTISARSLRNTRFTFMIGENDNAYGRRERCEKFNKEIQKLKEENKGEFPVEMEFKKGFGHGGLPDRDKIKEMYPYTRNPVPRHLTWDLTDSVLKHFFWIAVPQPGAGQRVEATIQDNKVEVATHNVKQCFLNLDGRLIDFGRPLILTHDNETQAHKLQPRLQTLCQSLLERGDPGLAYTCQVSVGGPKK